ncbi:MAG: bifunctional UDP-3-O-[3-hydroxymyristoyl] N-acetylglucosamine deacetylase/3-hydroxyacyl-ACP dehydratase [Bacteroidales bacterium]|nr:bifunctional UDP-3-O-[3-hydroxymyristoyl] N-acetylglucosamine deacetylase/3-hydroxyacyl-ACP dehydratase [Bacteroidales bacterium]MBS3773965.1 bifunctional UDP-3-O-[3-hydroxymyristoyl] N-acetylglucosamine deacetylase/3-hydroxyacyl-ACP dehydratase [Bacteroidales bacterium]
MSDKQKSIVNPVKLEGRGLHTGYEVEIKFKPAPSNHGIKFKRTDLKENPIIKASVNNVVDTSRGTTLEENGVKVHTVEHVLAALNGLEIDNVLVELNGPETPILDGSSRQIARSLTDAEIEELDEDKNYYYIKEKIEYKDEENQIELIAYPDEELSVNVLIDYNSKVLGHQFAIFNEKIDFLEELAPSRTFVFFHELEFLLKNNLIKGGDLENAIVIMENPVPQEELDRIADLFNKPHVKVKPEGVLNNIDLFYTNEPARHKLLDILGDMALIGRPIKGRIIAKKPGHHANTKFAKKILSSINKEASREHVPQIDINQKPLFNINQIKEYLPHRSPFLLIDKILQMDHSSIIGLKNVTMNEGFFVGHFPNEPLMPGVLQVESMAQVGGILALNSVPDPQNYITYFLKIDKVRFKRKVTPGDTLIYKLNLSNPIRRGIVTMFGQAFVGEQIVMEGELTAQITKNKEE